MTSDDRLRKYQEAGAEFIEAARAKAEELFRELGGMGEATGRQASAAAGDLRSSGRRSTDWVVEMVRREIAAQLAGLGLATRADLQQLEERLRGSGTVVPARKAPAAKVPAGKAPAKKAPVARKASGGKQQAPAAQAATAKAPAAKAAPAKAAARKAPAAKKAQASGGGQPVPAAKAPARKAPARKAPAKSAGAEASPAAGRAAGEGPAALFPDSRPGSER